MTPDTLHIDRTFRGVGRIKKATGTSNPIVRKKISRMLTALHEDGRLDILRAIRDGHVVLLEVWDAYQRKTLAKLPVAGTARKLSDAFEAWRDQLRVPDDYSADHVRTMETTLRHLKHARDGAMVADLPAVLEQLRDTLGKTAPRSFNLTRSHCMAFVRHTLKRSHPLWLAVSAVEPRKVVPSKPKRPLSVEQMQNFFPAPDTDPLDAIAWTMAATGMHAKELWGAWHVVPLGVRIDGTKRDGRRREVPLARTPAKPTMHPRTFANKLGERTGKQVSPYDLRRTYANWLESAGIPRTRRRLYMGHGARDVTDLYEVHEVHAFLREDAAKLRALLGLPPLTAHRLELAK